MHRGILLSLWYFHALLNSASTVYEPDENDGNVTVKSVTSSSISLKWELDHNFTDGTTITASIQPVVDIYLPGRLVWNESIEHYAADNVDHPSALTFWWKLGKIKSHIISKENFSHVMIIPINNLKYPNTDYHIHLRKTDGGSSEHSGEASSRTSEARIKVTTKPDVLSPKTGAGCFHVYYLYQKMRKVKVYWQGWYGQYEFSVYEVGKPDPVYVETGLTYNGYAWCFIGLKRHYAILKGYSEVGVSAEFSVVEIPPQKDIDSLPTFPIHGERTNNGYVLSWEKPKDLKVSNYTIFWLDQLDEKASSRIRDFMYLSSEKDSIEVIGGPGVQLGLSVNTEESSSGLQVAGPNENEDRPCPAPGKF